MRRFEMLGLPGAGKTTLAKMLPGALGVRRVRQLVERERLRARPLRRQQIAMRLMPVPLQLRVLTGPVPDAKDAAAFVLSNRRHHDAVLSTCDAVGDPAAREVALSLLFETWSHYGFADRVARPGDGLILDEGLWQRLSYPLAHAGTGGETLLDDLLGAVPRLDGLILLDIPLDAAVERVDTRGREFVDTGVMPAMEGWIARIASGLAEAGVPSTTIDAARPPDAILPDVVSFLRARMEHEVPQARADDLE